MYGTYVAFGLVYGASLASAALQRAPVVVASAQPNAVVVGEVPGPQAALPPRVTLPTVEPLSPLALIPEWRGTERVNILLLGIDQREDERGRGEPTRSDTMMVLSVDPVQKSATLVSFPRDLWVAIPGYGEERINVTYPLGEQRRIQGGGPGLASRTIESNFGLRTPYYVTVDFRGFQDVVNTLDGLIVDVPRPVRDNDFPTDTYGIERIYLFSGPQHMDGGSALKYARTRHADSDFARMARQQLIMLAMRDRMLRLNVLPRLPTLLDQGMRTVQTNFSPGDLLSLAKLAADIEPAAVGSLVVDGQLVVESRGAASVLLPKRDEIRRAIQRALADPRMLREGARVEIVASPTRALAAQTMLNLLAAESLQVTRRTIAIAEEPESTTITVFGDKPRSLAAVRRAVPLGDDAVQVAEGAPGVHIRITMGRESSLTPTPAP